MEQDLISKKDLLELTGISYGQLYRWKRKQLIPEQWFIRKSTFTGQETFFPRQLILSRIEKIVDRKEDFSLDEVAEMLSATPYDYEISKAALIERNIVSKEALRYWASKDAEDVVYPFDRILFFGLADRLLQTGDMSADEGEMVLDMLSRDYRKWGDHPCDLLFIRKMGISIAALLPADSGFYLDQGAKLVARISIQAEVEQLKGKLF
ncbi:YhbD family protein [Paenibacillus protaetiae]|uniref:DUF4004 family protein n=1 Tax=Paenibacillus protaetiae TaxID=2509456 RepID=A0A4P6ES67_9BACL|nr:YhbD family protein [Paenibacillus protaetiae]QAY65940.1 DUF4004 family protein [Paenibacillus protaetiae]